MSSGGQNSTTQTVTSLPPEYIKPHMENIAARAESLWGQGVGPQYFPGQTYVPFSDQTNQALQGAQAAATNNPLQQTAFNTTSGIMASNGIAPGTSFGLGQLQGIAGGQTNINTGGQYQNLVNNAGGIASGAQPYLGQLSNISSGADSVWTGDDYEAMRNQVGQGGLAQGTSTPLNQLGNIASGQNRVFSPTGVENNIGHLGINAAGTQGAIGAMNDYASGQYGIGTEADYRQQLANIDAGNPYLQQEIDNSNRKITDQIGSIMGASGRFGSPGAHAGVLADKLSQNTNTALFNQYNQDQAMRRGLLGDITGVQGQNVSNQLGAANSLFGNLQNAQNQYFNNQLGLGQQQINTQAMNVANQMGAANQQFQNLQGAQNQGYQQQLAALQGQTGVEQNNLAARTAANSNLANFHQQAQNQGFANQLQALQGLSGVQGANIANMGNTSQTMANINQNAQDTALKAALASPALADTRFNDYSRLADIGAQYETKQAEQLKDQIARYEFQNMQPWNQLGLLSGAIQGVNSGSTQNSVTQRPDAPLGQRLLGGGIAGGTLGASLGGPAGGLLGLLGGGLLGGFV